MLLESSNFPFKSPVITVLSGAFSVFFKEFNPSRKLNQFNNCIEKLILNLSFYFVKVSVSDERDNLG